VTTGWWHPDSEPLGVAPALRLSGLVPRAVRRGGMGVVYLCEDRRSRGRVAVKRVLPELLARPSAVTDFIRESRFWLQLTPHPNIVQVLGAHSLHPEPPCLELEFVRDSLRDRMRAGPVPAPDAARVFRDVGRGLRHMAAVLPGFVHADLKPENLLISAEGTTKISDFGLAGLRAEPGGGLGGTPLYMAPEQIQGRPEPAGDVYALGCIMVEVLAGTPAYGPPTDAADYRRRHLRAEPLSLATARPDLPGVLVDLVAGCLAKAPSDRPSPAELEAGLAALVPEPPSPGPTPTPADASNARIAVARALIQVGAPEAGLPMLDDVLGGRLRRRTELTARLARARGLNDQARDQERPELARLALADVDRADRLTDRGTPKAVQAEILLERARSLRGIGDPADLPRTIDLQRRALVLVPHSVLHMNIADAQREMGDDEAAIESLRRALAISASLQYHARIVMALLQNDDPEEAVFWGFDAVEYHPRLPLSHALRAWAIVGLLTTRPGPHPGSLTTTAIHDIGFVSRFQEGFSMWTAFAPLFDEFLARTGRSRPPASSARPPAGAPDPMRTEHSAAVAAQIQELVRRHGAGIEPEPRARPLPTRRPGGRGPSGSAPGTA
jgi:eukaryotic-like serine/threonine-protein kinase